MHGLSLELCVFALFLFRTLIFEGFLDYRDVQPFSGLGSWGMLFQFVICLSSCLSWSVGWFAFAT